MRSKPLLKVVCASWLLFCAGGWGQAALEPDPEASLIGQMVARILENNHYNHHPLDKKTSQDLLAQYLDMYDYNHMIFEKSDVDEFKARYGDALAAQAKQGDLRPAYEIFERFMKRLEEREALVRQILRSTPTFNTDDRLNINRHEEPWSRTPQEAQALWRLRIKYELLQERLNKAKPEERNKTISLRYERLLRSYRELDSSDILQNYLTALAHTFDPHSDYMAAPQMENFNINMRLSLVGIGAVLRSEDGYAKIVSLVPGGPADIDKRLKPNDRIEAVAQGDEPFVEAMGMKLDRLVGMIRGEKGTVVRLRVIPADAIDPSTRVVVSLVRDEIRLKDQEAKARLIELREPAGGALRIGVIDLPSFYADTKSIISSKSTTQDVEKLLEHLKKQDISGLILDLRRNGGGSLPESLSLTGLFIPKGPVVQIKDARGVTKVLKDTVSDVSYAGPMLVLTSRASASASEILAAALQDYGRAVVVGEKSTFGKGTVQSITELAQYLPSALKSYPPGAIKMTVQKFYRISGGSTQHRGVIPDIHLPSINDLLDMTESSLPGALPYDEVDPVSYQPSATVTPALLKQLRESSAKRLAASPEFTWVKEDMQRYERQKKEKFISLNERKRLEEKKRDEERLEARKIERLKRRSAGLTTAAISLDDALAQKPIVLSTGPVTVTAEPGETEKPSSPLPDVELEESARILSDMISYSSQATAAAIRRY
ncbi:MAG: carboxy terminal-processing peptidase [Elusimicrobia bacterium]|nr:carboxy terminal-processing peptidase [Elusimicrobiota bacterium]